MTREDIIRMAREAGFDALLPSEEILGRGRIYTGSDDDFMADAMLKERGK